METKKLVLIIIFSTSLLFLWEAWQKELQPPMPAEVTPGVTSSSTNQRHDPLPVPGDELVSSAESGNIPGVPGTTGGTPSVTPNLFTIGKKIQVRTDLIIAEIDTAGGDLRQLGLLTHPSKEDKNKPYQLLSDNAARFHVAQSGLVGEDMPNHKTQFTVESNTYNYELGTGQDKVVVRLLAPRINNIQVAKVYTFHRGTYVIDVTFEIHNESSTSIQPFSYFQMLRDANTPAGSAFMMQSYTGPAMYTDAEKFQKIAFSDIDQNQTEYPTNSDNGWIAMLEHYFLTAWLPEQQTPREYYAKRLAPNQYTAGVITPVGTIESGQTKDFSMKLYAGPQEQNKLAELSPGLELTVDYGWLTVLAKPLFWLLSFYHSWVGNWGFAIILLTLTVKLIFFPLSAAGYRSMAKMRVVTPKLQRIREQYGSDKQRMNQAMMDFYREEKINPMGGCLPILVQIPVFIALFWTLLAAVELRYAPFVLWITDLSAPDPYYVLPLVMGISMWIQSKLSPTPADPIQAKVMQIMPIAFSVFFFFFPSGLVLYSLVNNILSIAQQWQITRMFENAEDSSSKKANNVKIKSKEERVLSSPSDEDKQTPVAVAAEEPQSSSNKKNGNRRNNKKK